MVRPPKSLEVKLDLKLLSIAGTWEPNHTERRAAWELYVELVTRISTVPLRDGLLREALTSLYSLFGTSREVLRRYGPELAEPKKDGLYSLGHIVVAMLNAAVRPVLARWHPELEAWEAARPPDRSRLDHEHAWPNESELRGALDELRPQLTSYAQLLGKACGVPDLTAVVAIPAARAPSS